MQQKPPFWNELTKTQRETWEALKRARRDSLTEVYQANHDQHGPDRSLEVVCKALDNTTKPPGAETARTDARARPITDEQLEQHQQEREREHEARKQDVSRRSKGWSEEPLTQREERLRREAKASTAGRHHPKPANKLKPELPPADRQALDKALLETTSSADVLKAIGRLMWVEQRGRPGVPDEQIPTETALTNWIAHAPQEAQDEAAELLDKLNKRNLKSKKKWY